LTEYFRVTRCCCCLFQKEHRNRRVKKTSIGAMNNVMGQLHSPKFRPTVLEGIANYRKRSSAVQKEVQTIVKTVVFVRVVILKIGEMDLLRKRFSADVFLQMKWREDSLDGLENLVRSIDAYGHRLPRESVAE